MRTQTHSRLAALQDHLDRYLPGQSLQALLSQPGPATIRPCVAHLNALLRAVSTYLPRYLVNEQLIDPKPGQVSGRFREATIMFTDISGFTAMSERLSQQGEKGAEKITNIVGDYFTRLLEITACQGGDLLKFGGDAMLVAFFGDDDPDTLDHALNAVRAAAQMQEAIARFSEVEAFGETFRLKMTVGLGSGPLFTANLGTVDKMEYTVMGEALANMAHAEDQAEGGEIFIDELTYRAVKPWVQTGDLRDGCYQVTHVRDHNQTCTSAPPAITLPQSGGRDLASQIERLQTLTTCLDALAPFLPPGLLDLLRFDPAHMAARERGEFRPVTTIFANFYGIEEIIRALGPSRSAEITGILNAHFTEMQKIIHRYDGVIDKVDSYVVGHRIMALFGAPRAHVDDPERAVRAAWEMQAKMQTFANLETSAGAFALKQRIGINSGRVFAGNVGSETRHEYSVMGDEVNLTARLMSAAQEDQILISQSTAAQVGKRFRLHEQTPVKVKGKSKPVPNYRVQGVTNRRQQGEAIHRSPLIGRDEEWQTIQRTARQTLDGACRILDIHGEMGMGKSRITEELLDYWTQQGGHVLFAGCLSYGRHTPYAPWITILRDLFGLSEQDSEQERREKIVTRLTAANPEWLDWAALVANLLGVPMPESDLLRSLDPKLRQQNLRRIVASLISTAAAYHPTLLIIDDLQWIDQVSLELLNYVASHIRSRPLLIGVTYRPEEPIDLRVTKQDNYTSITLKTLSQASSLELLNSQLPTEPEIPPRLKQVILKNAQGNPLFVVEMAHALIENYLSYDAASGVYRAQTDLDRVQVPDTVSRVILSRLDRLDEQSRNMLKVASAIGRAFQQWLLQSIYPYQTNTQEMAAHLIELVEKEILDHAPGSDRASAAELAYLYRHVMTREVAYESLLYAERRELHCKIAQTIETQRDAQVGEYLEVLADHYTLAEAWPQALVYHIKAAGRAQAVYANQDAIHRYKQVLAVAQHLPDSQAEQIVAHEGLGDAFELTGQYDESLESYAQARSMLEQMPPSLETQRYRAELCRKTGHIYEYRGEYDTTLEWVNHGLRLLGAADCIETARLYLLRAGIHHRQGNNPEAIRWCEQAIQITSNERDPEYAHETAHAAHLMSEIYRRLGENEQAVEFAQRSLNIYQELEDIVGQGQAHISLGNAYSAKYDWTVATDHYLKGMTIKERVGDVYGQGVLAINIGDNYRIMGQLEQAIVYCRRSLQVWEELGVTYGEGLAHNNLGAIYLRLGNLTQATQHLEQSETLLAQIPSEDFVAETSRYRAQIALQQGQIDRALTFAAKSLQYAIDQGLKSDECATRRVLGSIYLAQGDLDLAQEHLGHSLALADELDDRYEKSCTLAQLGRLQRRQGQPTQAQKTWRQAKTLFESLEASLDVELVEQDLAGLE